MTKNERLLQWVMAGVFFVVCFAFFQWFYPNHLFMKEQMRIFLYTTDYFISFWDEPAWLTCYVGNFLTQFFYLKMVGPLIVTCVLLLQWYVSMRVLRKFGGGNMVSVYALLPVALEWGLICRFTYNISTTLSLILVLWLFLLYIRIRDRRVSVWVAFILLPLIYSLAGSRLFIFSLMVIFYGGAKSRKRWWFWLTLLLASYLYPLFMRDFYGLSVEEAYSFSHIDGYSIYFPAMLLVLEIFALQIKYIRRIRLRRQNIIVTTFALFLVFGLVIVNTNLKREKILALDNAVYNEDWEQVITLSNAIDFQSPLVSYCRNIAFSKKGELADNLMRYYQPGSDALFLSIDSRSSMLSVYLSNEVYYQLGDLDMARHRAIQGILFSPKQRSVRLIKRLVEIDFRKGDVKEARKYLHLLDATLFYREWAREKEVQLDGVESHLSGENPLPRKEDWEREYDITYPMSDYPDVLMGLVKAQPGNKQVLDYVLCYYLLNQNLTGFKTAFDSYYKGKYTVVPRLYEEALLLVSKGQEEELASYQISQEVISDYKNYLDRKSGRKAKEELHGRYSSTYWYYSDCACR